MNKMLVTGKKVTKSAMLWPDIERIVKLMDSGREIVIMVDDDIMNLTVGKNALSEKYQFLSAPSGKKLFSLMEKISPDLILLDIAMPEMTGYDVIKILKADPRTVGIPVIFLTAKIDPESEIEGLSLGAVDYLYKPFLPELLIKRIDLHILFEKQKKELQNYSRSLEGEVDQKTKTVLELQNAILKTVAELVECRDSVTGGHIERTQHYLSMLVDFLLEHNIYTDELASWDIGLFIMSSQLHDVGKISIKDEILLKPGKLTDEEFEEMKRHSEYGLNIIRKIEESATENEFLHYAETMAVSHHEKWNGTGYPYGLKGNAIPLQGRLMAIVDVYDALTNARPYKTAFTHEKAIDIIRSERGAQFDPLICDAFLLHEKEFSKRETETNAHHGVFEKQESADKLQTAIKMVANIVDVRGGTDGGHTDSMQRILKLFIDALADHESYREEVSVWDQELFLMSAHLHDIGKIAVHDSILNKPSELTNDEHEYYKTHADFGVKVVKQIKENVVNENLLHHAEALIGSHHEKWDGTGYPMGLKGSGIPLQGRIMAIVDVYVSLVNDRPNRGRKTHEEAVGIIRSGSGTLFDPELVDVFLEREREFIEVEL